MVAATPLEHDLKSLFKTIGVMSIIVPAVALSEMHVVVIEGLGGEPRYTEQFGEQVPDAGGSHPAECHDRCRSSTAADNAKVRARSCLYTRVGRNLAVADEHARRGSKS